MEHRAGEIDIEHEGFGVPPDRYQEFETILREGTGSDVLTGIVDDAIEEQLRVSLDGEGALIGAGGVSLRVMPEEVLFKSESGHSREEIASYLRTVADTLEHGDTVTLTSGSESVTLEPPARPTFEVKAEREGPTDGPGELSIEFELEWDENAGEETGGSDQLEIQ